MKRKIKIIQFGLGQIGASIARTIVDHDEVFELVGCVDSSPEKEGRDLNTLVGAEEKRRVSVAGSIELLKSKRANVVVHSTVSFLPEAAVQVKKLLAQKYNVITTSEELFFLKWRNPKLFRSLDAVAKRNRVRLLATGVNPGYVMDSLVLMLTAPCTSISSIRSERMVNLSKRRLALQRKLGIGLTGQEFAESAEAKRYGHAGLRDSAEFVVHYLGLKHDHIKSEMEPIIADYDYHGDDMFVAKGHVLGVRHEVVVEKVREAVLSLRLVMRIDASIEYDAVTIDAVPPVNVVINNGIMGDIATAGMIANQIPSFLDLPPGCHDMSEVRLPHYSLANIG